MLSKVVYSKNKFFFVFLLTGYLLGVIFYDFIGFKYVDELLIFILFFVTVFLVKERKKKQDIIPLLVLVGIFTFYTLYSFSIQSNIPKAILKDCIIQIKPFLAFYCAYIIAPTLTKIEKHIICIVCIIIACFLLIIYLIDPFFHFFVHPSRYATAVVVTFFLLFYCSACTWKDILFLIIILALGLASSRAKFYGFFGLSICLLIYYKIIGKIYLNIKTILLFILLIGITVWLAKEKIIIYYVDGMMNSREMWSRPAMMLTGGRILWDYFPFGCGLGSFASYASAEYYSSIYSAYGIDQLWGLSRQNPIFICDAYYPSLAQFGIIGVILYSIFWIKILWKARTLNAHYQLLIWIGFFFFLIEGVADTTFTHNRGVFILILLGITLAQKNEVTKRDI